MHNTPAIGSTTASQPVHLSPNKVAIVFASSFMILAVGGGVPGLFSLELSLVAGGLSLPFFGLALSQCKKSEESAPAAPSFTYAQFQAAFTGKNYRLVLLDGEPRLDISLDPERLGDAKSFEGYRSQLAFSVRAKLAIWKENKPLPLLTPKCIIGPNQLPLQFDTSSLEQTILHSIPSVEQLHELYEMALKDRTPQPEQPTLATEEETLAFVTRNAEWRIKWMTYPLKSGGDCALWFFGNVPGPKDWATYHLNIVDVSRDILQRSGGFQDDLSPCAMWNNATSTGLKNIVFPEPSSLNISPDDFFTKKWNAQNLRSCSEKLANAILQAIRINVRKQLDEEHFYKHARAFKYTFIDFVNANSMAKGLHNIFTDCIDAQSWRENFIKLICDLPFKALHVKTMGEAHQMLSSCTINLDSQRHKIHLTPEQFPLQVPPETPVDPSIIRDWLPHFEAAILKVKPLKEHG